MHRILSADPPDDHTEELVFDPDGPAAPTATGLTIGSQLAEYGGAHYLVAHEKWRVASWRAYLVRWVKLRDLTTEPQIEVSPRRLCFSRRALLGQFPKHNRNLLSCTYFSRLQVEGGFAVLGFGINDVRFGFCEIRMDEL